LEDGFLSSGAAAAKDVKGQKGYKVSESENGLRSLGTIENFNSIKEGSLVEVWIRQLFLGSIIGIVNLNI
jgi:hypothetical protein